MTRWLAFLALFSSQAPAFPLLRCMTEYPSTTITLKPLESNTKLRVTHHNGLDFIPVFRGVATPSDVSIILKRGTFFKELGEEFSLFFAKEDCTYEGAFYYRCHINTPITLHGKKIDMVYFSTSDTIDRLSDMGFLKTNISLSLRVGDEEFKLETSYNDGECSHQE